MRDAGPGTCPRHHLNLQAGQILMGSTTGPPGLCGECAKKIPGELGSTAISCHSPLPWGQDTEEHAAGCHLPSVPCLSDSTHGNLVSPGLGQTKTAKVQEGPVEGGWGALPAFGWGRADRLVQPGEGPVRLPWLPKQARHGTRWAGQPLWRRGTTGQHHGTPGAGSLPPLPLVPL